MKKILLFLLMFAAYAVKSDAQSPPIEVFNYTRCSVEVTVHCYDLCVLGISHPPKLVLPNGGSAGLDTCTLGSGAVSVIYEVCWTAPGCGATPNCVFVVGPGNGNTCGLPIGNTIRNCRDCNPASNGEATVTFNGSQLIIK